MLRHNPAKNIAALKAANLDPASQPDIEVAHAMAVRLIGPQLASVELLTAIQEKTRASVYVFREDGRITGVLGELPLSTHGLGAIEGARFDGARPQLDQVAAPGEPVLAYYCWGNAAETRRAAAATVRGMIIARDEIYPELPYFARAVVPAGADDDAGSNGARISFRRFDCTYYPGQPDLLYSPKARSLGRPAA